MLRLMIVDDEQIIRDALSRMIDYEAIGYQLVGTAKNGMEAYDILCDEYPDVIITDIRMPILSGLELIERAIKSDTRITFILLSGYGEFEYAKQAMQYGVRHYLLKPTNKTELLQTLLSVRDEHQLKARQEQERQNQLLGKLQKPLEQCFVTEALECHNDFSGIFSKYQPLLSLPSGGACACICSYVEEFCIKAFSGDVYRYLNNYQITCCLPIIYVKNNAILFFTDMSLMTKEKIQAYLEQLHYPGQSVSFIPHFLHEESTSGLFQAVFAKISRFDEIRLLDQAGSSHLLRNNIASPRRLCQISEQIAQSGNEEQVAAILDSLFAEDISLDAARSLALGLFLGTNPQREPKPLDIAGEFFRKLYTCPTIEEIRLLMHVFLLQSSQKPHSTTSGANIGLLKTYVAEHLDAENLSLKWLAEHYLFVSVGYLSKQFVKEEGLRFSDYLNKKRMEEASRLMTLYRSDNIKNIARQVGFGSNPQYFSQVFKRYIGLTPTEYMEQLK